MSTPTNLDRTQFVLNVNGQHRDVAKTVLPKTLKNIYIVGKKDCGKTSILDSFCRAFFPDRTIDISHQKVDRKTIINFQFVQTLTIWEFPCINTEEGWNMMMDGIRGGVNGMPPVPDFVLFVLNPDDIVATETDYNTKIKTCIAGLRKAAILVTKLDTVAAESLPALFATCSKMLGIPKSAIYPVKNATTEQNTTLLDYFILRVLVKLLAILGA